ncbi:MAG TPA: ABC transporter permease [Allosphingosinicella sp.]|nr:ABC transporter permease [Allosphingosinicella sp.]
MFRQFKTVFQTTLLDQSRDRRSIGAAFIYALFGPVLMLGMFTMMAKTQDSDRTTRLAVVGAQHAPTLVAELERRGIKVERRSGPLASGPANALPEKLGDADALLFIPDDFARRFDAGTPAKLMLLRDDRRQSSSAAANRLERQLQEYGSFIVQSRLISRGMAAENMMPLLVRSTNISEASGKTMYLAGSMLAFFILAPFFTSMTTAIDVTAGERERQSLKPLLAQPVHPTALVLGKWAVPALFAIVGTAITAALGFVLLRYAPLDKLGVALSLDALRLLYMIVFLIPLALAVAALQSAVAMLAKSFKEAQTYIQLLTFAPLILLFTNMMSGDTGPIARLMPITGHGDVLRTLLSNGAVDTGQAIVISVLTLALCAVGLVISQRQLADEKLLAQL